MAISALLPITDATVSANPNAGNAQITSLKRGIKYRVVADGDCFININGGAGAGVGLYLPAKVIDYIAVGMGDSQGTDPVVNVYAAGNVKIYFTPVIPVSA